jgi:3-methyladenine DNA glycosylase AlkD
MIISLFYQRQIINIMELKGLIKEINKHKDQKLAKKYEEIFTSLTDKFIGIRVPVMRETIKSKNLDLISLDDIKKLLKSKIHEYKFTALIILTEKYDRTNDIKYVKFYVKNIKYINNWDFVDVSAYKILGKHIYENKKNSKSDDIFNFNTLHTLAKSKNVWQRRIAIISTYYFIKKGLFKHTLEIAKKYIESDDVESTIHKATGWMLREVGKVDKKVLINFLNTYHEKMPQIMLNYSVEKLSDRQKKKYFKK